MCPTIGIGDLPAWKLAKNSPIADSGVEWRFDYTSYADSIVSQGEAATIEPIDATPVHQKFTHKMEHPHTQKTVIAVSDLTTVITGSLIRIEQHGASRW
jgi:hypothetical protein